jgi:hypothetical protein
MTSMSHYSRLLKVVIDVPPGLHDQELAFWQDALGQELPEIYSAEYHGAFLRGNDLMLLMQRLESGASRVHLDSAGSDHDYGRPAWGGWNGFSTRTPEYS